MSADDVTRGWLADDETRDWLAKDVADVAAHRQAEADERTYRDTLESTNLHDDEQLARHLRDDHGITPVEGRSLWHQHYFAHFGEGVAPIQYTGWSTFHVHTSPKGNR